MNLRTSGKVKMMSEEACKNCRFWDLESRHPYQEEHIDDQEAACRRHPPIFDRVALNEYRSGELDTYADYCNGIYDWRFWSQPYTNGHMWCGEYERRVDA